MKLRSLALTLSVVAAAAGIVACSGGGGSGSAYSVPTMPASVVASPSAAPSSSAAPATPGTTTLAEATLLGSPGFVNTNGRTVYVLSNDTVGSLSCTAAAGCLGVWPPVAPPAGVALTAGFTAFARPDTGAMQLVYNNHPLYEYAGDSAAGQTNGNGIVSFGGTWSVGRP
jgi:predicted lipoprotein with Yx(FWY)xxD motif